MRTMVACTLGLLIGLSVNIYRDHKDLKDRINKMDREFNPTMCFCEGEDQGAVTLDG